MKVLIYLFLIVFGVAFMSWRDSAENEKRQARQLKELKAEKGFPQVPEILSYDASGRKVIN